MTVARLEALKSLGYAFSSGTQSNDIDNSAPLHARQSNGHCNDSMSRSPNVELSAGAKTQNTLNRSTRNTLNRFADLNLNKNDVIMEQKLLSNQNIGNLRLRIILEMMSEEYSKTSKGSERTKIAKSIVKSIRRANPPGRFLRKDSDSGLYVDVGDGDAMENVKECLDNAETLFEDETGAINVPSNGNERDENSAYDKSFVDLLQRQQNLLKNAMLGQWKEDAKKR